MVLQTVLVPTVNKNGKAISLKKAIKWVKSKGYKEYFTYKSKDPSSGMVKKIKKGVHITDKYYRFRQAEPLTQSQKKKGWAYASDKLKNGVILIWMYQI